MNPKTSKHLHKLVERYLTFFLGVESENSTKKFGGKIYFHFPRHHLNVSLDEDAQSNLLQRIESKDGKHFLIIKTAQDLMREETTDWLSQITQVPFHVNSLPFSLKCKIKTYRKRKMSNRLKKKKRHEACIKVQKEETERNIRVKMKIS